MKKNRKPILIYTLMYCFVFYVLFVCLFYLFLLCAARNNLEQTLTQSGRENIYLLEMYTITSSIYKGKLFLAANAG